MPQDYMSVLSSARSKDFYAIWGLCGNAFSVPVVVYILEALDRCFPTENYQNYPFSYTLSKRTKLPPPVGNVSEVDVDEEGMLGEALLTVQGTQTQSESRADGVELKDDGDASFRPLNSARWRPGLDSLGERHKLGQKNKNLKKRGATILVKTDKDVDAEVSPEITEKSAITNTLDVEEYEPDLEAQKMINEELRHELKTLRQKMTAMEDAEDAVRLKQQRLIQVKI